MIANILLVKTYKFPSSDRNKNRFGRVFVRKNKRSGVGTDSGVNQ